MPKKRQRRAAVVHLAAADPYIVRQLMEHLLTAYNEFINNYPGNVDYIDGLLGAPGA